MASDDDDAGDRSVKGLAERYWSADPALLSHDAVSPLHATICELAPFQDGKLAFLMAFGNVTVLDTPDGLVLVDCASPMAAPGVFDKIREFSDKPLNTVVFTHGHVDHVFGVKWFERESAEKGWAKPRVVAHENVPRRFDRYKLTRGYNSAINSRQFQFPVEWPVDYRYPDVTYRDAMVLDVGGETLELYHAEGETDDATWVFMPKRRVLCTGDFVIWAAPNCGNPQKVQRYPIQWAKALRRMAGKKAELLFPGHGPPVIGADRVEKLLTDTASFLEGVVRHSLAGINKGQRLNKVVHELPSQGELLSKPYLRPTYDDPRFIVSSMWRLYAGWWDQDPAHLLPPKEQDLAATVCGMAGGARALADRAKAFAAAKKLEVAAQCAEWAAAHVDETGASPADVGYVHAARAEVYAAREAVETSLMAQSVFRAAKLESEARVDEAGGDDSGRGGGTGDGRRSAASSAIEARRAAAVVRGLQFGHACVHDAMMPGRGCGSGCGGCGLESCVEPPSRSSEDDAHPRSRL